MKIFQDNFKCWPNIDKMKKDVIFGKIELAAIRLAPLEIMLGAQILLQ